MSCNDYTPALRRRPGTAAHLALPAELPEDGAATDRQRWYLDGFAISVPVGLTKSEASDLISQALADGRRADPALLYTEDEPPTARMLKVLARNGLQAQTAREASMIIDSLPKPPPRAERPPTEKQARRLARRGLQAETAGEAVAMIGSLPKREPRSAAAALSEQVRALAVEEPFRHGIAGLARRLGLKEATVSRTVRRLEAEGSISVRLEAGCFPRKLVGVVS